MAPTSSKPFAVEEVLNTYLVPLGYQAEFDPITGIGYIMEGQENRAKIRVEESYPLGAPKNGAEVTGIKLVISSNLGIGYGVFVDIARASKELSTEAINGMLRVMWFYHSDGIVTCARNLIEQRIGKFFYVSTDLNGATFKFLSHSDLDTPQREVDISVVITDKGKATLVLGDRSFDDAFFTTSQGYTYKLKPEASRMLNEALEAAGYPAR
jgi:hypothetical protein